ncbi:hypothetical protein TNCV_2101031 [Trichonephila clavipes]|nr:hypothetical protein TNCV_2101031 [Trichonephila clavipes]
MEERRETSMDAYGVFSEDQSMRRYPHTQERAEALIKSTVQRYMLNSLNTEKLLTQISAKEQKVQDSKCNKEFQTWWIYKHGILGSQKSQILFSKK